MLAAGDETKQMLVRVERVGRICPGQFLAMRWVQVLFWTPCSFFFFFASCFPFELLLGTGSTGFWNDAKMQGCQQKDEVEV